MIFDDQVYCSDGQDYSSNDAHILFMIGMERYFRRLILCSRVAPLVKSAAYTIPREIEIGSDIHVMLALCRSRRQVIVADE
jgi:hypothetical protein